MASPDLPGISTPKRKHHQLEHDDGIPSLTSAVLPPESIALPPSSPADDGSTSPRTKVAHRFRSLAIGRSRISAENVKHARFTHVRDPTTTIPETPQPSGKNVSGDAMQEDTDEGDHGSRKRLKVPEQGNLKGPEADERDLPHTLRKISPSKAPVAFAIERPGTPRLKKSPAAPATPSDEPKHQPLNPHTTSTSTFQWPPSPPDTEAITVAFRASMTWQEDEITIYDPDDSDDDGTGINGIGFKPTAAVAYARGVKRKQQLAEYRKREEREARARRSQKRRGTASPRPTSPRRAVASVDERERERKGGKGKVREEETQKRRVRFLEESVVAAAAVTTSS